jgi:hypothetical protein
MQRGGDAWTPYTALTAYPPLDPPEDFWDSMPGMFIYSLNVSRDCRDDSSHAVERLELARVAGGSPTHNHQERPGGTLCGSGEEGTRDGVESFPGAQVADETLTYNRPVRPGGTYCGSGVEGTGYGSHTDEVLTGKRPEEDQPSESRLPKKQRQD